MEQPRSESVDETAVDAEKKPQNETKAARESENNVHFHESDSHKVKTQLKVTSMYISAGQVGLGKVTLIQFQTREL